MSERLYRMEKLMEKSLQDTIELREAQKKTDEQIEETSKELARVWKKIDKLWKLYWNSENNK